MNSDSPNKFIGHYTNDGLIAALASMDKFQEFAEQSQREFEMDALTLARQLTGKYKPEPKVMTWCKRFIKVYYSPIVRKAFENAKVSARYAYDIADYVEYEECADIIRDACAGKFGNTEFRKKIKDARSY